MGGFFWRDSSKKENVGPGETSKGEKVESTNNQRKGKGGKRDMRGEVVEKSAKKGAAKKKKDTDGKARVTD